MSKLKPDTSFVLKAVFVKPSTILDFTSGEKAPVLNAPSGDFNFSAQQGKPSAILDLGYVATEQTVHTPSSNFNFIDTQGAPSSNFDFGSIDVEVITLYPVGFHQTRYGYPTLSSGTAALLPYGVFSSGSVGSPNIRNNAVAITPKGFALGKVGYSKIENLLKIVSMGGIKPPTASNGHYLQGGVRWIATYGAITTSFGSETFALNTTGDRGISPSGFSPTGFGFPLVSPTIVYANGWTSSRISSPVAKEASLLPKGSDHSVIGSVTAWYHTRPIDAIGFNGYSTGYPRVFDPTQFINTPSLITSAVFGDVYIKNLYSFLKPVSIDNNLIPDWTVLTNRNRHLSPGKFSLHGFGGVAVQNKTPSIFLEAISQTKAGTPAVGYRVRAVFPSGFDRLNLGRPVLTKTPEITPRSFAPSFIPEPFISHRVRGVYTTGYVSSTYGNHRAWFRYRYVSPISWKSERIGAAVLTHGVREVISRGYTSEGYGSPWASFGLRVIAPSGAHNDFSSLHMVGGPRDINPIGYVATLFGERVTPVATNVYPQGLSTKWGLSEIGLSTREVRPVGYISFGQQPSERWGQTSAYNLVQYISPLHNQDIDNGLIPPKWSEWTLVENRDKQINVTAFNALRMGYTQIYNDGTVLLPLGIAPPVSIGKNVSMVAYGVRHINVDAIDAPIVSSWLVVFNDARAIGPYGLIASSIGQPKLENTRRYYAGVGRIDSLDFSEPMISHAIRAINIEKRYSISPPQIDLPVVELLTRYIEPQGYERRAYGTPSLSIELRVIKPYWAYRDKVGDPYARNLTPEITSYGHNSEEHGTAKIRTEWRYVYAKGDAATLFGLSKISDSKQSIAVRGWRDIVVSQSHQVIKKGAPLYSRQSISLDGWFDFSSGTSVPGNGINSEETTKLSGSNRVPSPILNRNSILPSGIISLLFGGTKIWTNVIYMTAGISQHVVSDKLRVHDRNHRITFKESDAIESNIAIGKPRLSPNTIWAMTEAPAQAQANQPAIGRLHGIDGLRFEGATAAFGTPKVDSTIRTVYSSWGPDKIRDSIGALAVELSKRYIYPRSFRRINIGMPSIPFTPQGMTTFGDTPMTLYGDTAISMPRDLIQLAAPTGFNSLGLGLETEAQLFTRPVFARGHNSESMGVSIYNDKPFMWQGLRIGELVPSNIGGDDMLMIGNAWVSLRVRGIITDGFNDLSMNYDYSSFTDRMRVFLAHGPTIPDDQNIGTNGFVVTNYGNADARFGQYFITPDGNSNQFRKGGYDA